MGVLQLGDTKFRNDANLKAYYKLEGTADELATYHLTNINTVTFSAAQFVNGANFGTAWYHTKTLKNASNAGVDMDNNWSVNMWLKANTAPPAGTSSSFFTLAETSKGHTSLIYEAGPRFNLYLDGQYGAYSYNLGTSDFYMLTMTRNSGTGYLYVNAEYLGGHAFGTASQTSYLYVGNNTATSAGCPVIIDDLSLFNRTLTISEINELFTGPGTKFDLTSKSW